jgi:hypothetical protein
MAFFSVRLWVIHNKIKLSIASGGKLYRVSLFLFKKKRQEFPGAFVKNG